MKAPAAPTDQAAFTTTSRIKYNWSMDFMSDSLASGSRLRTFNIIDDHNREVLAIDIATSIGANRVIRNLERIIVMDHPKR